MECNFCTQQKTKLYCHRCVKEGIRQQNYQKRAALVKKEETTKKVHEYLTSDARRVWQAHADRDEKKVEIGQIKHESERIHGLIRKERQRLENVKTDIATRKSNLASAHKGLKANHVSGMTSLKAEISRLKDKMDLVHQNIAIARRSRCKEAADLLGLRKLSSKEESFIIAGVTLANLHLIKHYTPSTVMLGISHATHLLTILADYLSLKLPFEIHPPSRGVYYFTIRKTSQSKLLPLYLPPEAFSSTSARAWSSKKIKDIPDLLLFVEAISLLAWDLAWILWSQRLWPTDENGNEVMEACRIGRNLHYLVNSPNIGLISHGSTIEYLPLQSSVGVLPAFALNVDDIYSVIKGALEEDKNGDGDGGGWDMVEGGEEVLRGDGWLKLNSAGHSEA